MFDAFVSVLELLSDFLWPLAWPQRQTSSIIIYLSSLHNASASLLYGTQFTIVSLLFCSLVANKLYHVYIYNTLYLMSISPTQLSIMHILEFHVVICG